MTVVVGRGQYVEGVSWSGAVEISKGEKVEQLFAIDDTTSGLLLNTTGGYSVALIGSTSKRIDLESNGTVSIVRQFIRGNTLTVFSSVPTDLGTSQRFTQYSIDPDSVTKNAELDFDLGMSAGARSKPISAYVSQDGAFALACRQSAYRRTMNASIQLVIIADGQLIESKIPTEYAGDDFELLGASIDNRGQVYIAAKTGIKLNSPFRRKQLLLSYNHQDQRLTEFDLSSDKIFTQDFVFKTNSSGVEIASLYTIEPLEETHSDGYVYISIDSIGENIEERKIRTFTPEMISDNRSLDSKKPGIEHVFLDRIFSLNNEPLVTFDRRFQDQVCTTDPRTGIVSCTDMYYFKGVFIESPFDRRISATIQRNQVDVDRLSMHSSHGWIQYEDRLFIFYNDHFKNENEQSERMMSNPSRSAIRFIIVDAQGISSTGVLTEERQADFAYVPGSGVARSGSTTYLLSRDGRSYRVGKLNLSKLLAPTEGY